MIDSVMRRWAEQRGFPELGDVIVDTSAPMEMSYAHAPELNGWVASVAIDPATWSKEVQKDLAKRAKKIGIISYQNDAVMLIVRANTRDGKLAKLEQAGQFLQATLPEMGIRPSAVCQYCKNAGCDDHVSVNNAMYPCHTACKEQQAAMIYAEVQNNLQNGSVVLGIICALIGGLIGCLPLLLNVYLMDGTYYVILYFLIPLAAYGGYKLGKGVLNSWVPIICAAISLVCCLITVVVAEYIVFVQAIPLPFGDFMNLMTLPQMKAAYGEMFGRPLLYTVIGIAVSWGMLTQGNKQKIKQAEALRASMGVKPGVQPPMGAAQQPVAPQQLPVQPMQPVQSEPVPVQPEEPKGPGIS